MFSNFFSTPTSKDHTPDLIISATQSTLSVSSATSQSLFSAADLTPPSKWKTEGKEAVIGTATKILSLLDVDWNGLDATQKAYIAFLVWKNQHTMLKNKTTLNSREIAQKILDAATNKDSIPYQTLNAFLRNDETKVTDEVMNELEDLNLFRKKHTKWNNADDPLVYTIFTFRINCPQLFPVIRYQTKISKVCFAISAANAVLYYMWLTKKARDKTEAVNSYGIKIGRLLRNELTDEQTYDMIFKHQGEYPTYIFDNLLSFEEHQPGTNTTYFFHIGKKLNLDLLFSSLMLYLQSHGPLVVQAFKIFEEYQDAQVTEFYGGKNYTFIKQDGKDVYHAFLVVGIRKTASKDDMGGIQFLVQDSMIGRPFVGIGLDLLHFMNITVLLGIQPGAIFAHNRNVANLFDEDDIIPSAIVSGSPRPSQCVTSNADVAVSESVTMEDDNSSSVFYPLDIPDDLNGKHFCIYT